MSAQPEPKPKRAKPDSEAFDWADPLLLDAELSGEERMVRDSARSFCEGKLFPACATGSGTRPSTAPS